MPNLIPKGFTLRGYEQLINNSQIIDWTVNTVILVGATTIVVLLVDAMIAYSLTRLEWPGRKLVFSAIVGCFMVPGIINLVPVFMIVSDSDWSTA